MHAGGMGAPIGKLENTPHGTMHVAVGGFMGAFNTAGLDPLFWLHHANIDRLWVVWRDRNPQHLDPAQSQWLTGVSFFLHDAQGAEVSHTASEVVDTTVAPLDYRYDNVADPIGGVMGAAPEAARRTTMAAQQPEMVGASEGPIVLTGGAATTRLAVSAPTGPAALRSAAEPPAVHLNIENVTGLESEGTYAVYAPGAAPPATVAGAFALAAAWQLLPVKRRALTACHWTMPLAPRGWRANRDCLRYGWTIGGSCLVSCGGLMLACVLAGHSLPAMVAATAVAAAERVSARADAWITSAALALVAAAQFATIAVADLV